jgi:hypothetical protein
MFQKIVTHILKNSKIILLVFCRNFFFKSYVCIQNSVSIRIIQAKHDWNKRDVSVIQLCVFINSNSFWCFFILFDELG